MAIIGKIFTWLAIIGWAVLAILVIDTILFDGYLLKELCNAAV